MEMDKATSDNALKNLMQSLEADAAALQNNLNAVLSDAGCVPENKLRQLKKNTVSVSGRHPCDAAAAG